ncbi:pirin family protein [Chitinophaga sp. XS-30]|uniref:pirin family protein n=1 Tax=Chitinophaga sp. XS-30 TaxID=2604421 RepID=UPI0011DC8211|nr:pirin-like C-terminal cupin domain-containing protein [Chitinophaga sp. XS-30]QEH42642.1 pirin family protein [Chitinophaga sp. XS-30]
MKKAIQHILQGREKRITEDETVIQPLPHKDFRFANPFIVLHHIGPETIPAGSAMRIHPHPHRGFSPVSFFIQGAGYHMDNAGHSGTIEAGGIQWMFAGKGLLHSEGPTKEILEKGGVQEMIQIWVNVPKAHKWDEPYYQSASKEQLPRVLEQDGVELRLASGEYEGKRSPMKSFTPVIAINGAIEKGKTVSITATPGYQALLYVSKGSFLVNGQETAQMHQLVVFEKEHDEIVITANEDSAILYLSAEPIDEPVAAKDNFVMNTPEEVEQAMADYRNGVFGTLEY